MTGPGKQQRHNEGRTDGTAGWVEAAPVRSGGGKSRRVVLKFEPAKIRWDMEPLHVQCVGIFFGVPVFLALGMVDASLSSMFFQPFDDFFSERVVLGDLLEMLSHGYYTTNSGVWQFSFAMERIMVQPKGCWVTV